MSARGILEKGLELIYPPDLYCICCGNLIDESRTYHLCDHCREHIRFDGAEPVKKQEMEMTFCTRYGLYERTLIFGLKYNGKKYLARDLAEMMADRLSLTDWNFDLIVPVPMFSAKEQARGFNHAALMGKYLGRFYEKPCAKDALLRTADTRPMRGLSPSERAVNVKNKFAVSPKWRGKLSGKRILLIDDFYTTGSTAGECFRALQAEKPEKIYFLAFAAR